MFSELVAAALIASKLLPVTLESWACRCMKPRIHFLPGRPS